MTFRLLVLILVAVLLTAVAVLTGYWAALLAGAALAALCFWWRQRR